MILRFVVVIQDTEFEESVFCSKMPSNPIPMNLHSISLLKHQIIHEKRSERRWKEGGRGGEREEEKGPIAENFYQRKNSGKI